MGKSQFIKNASIAFMVLGVALIGTNFLNKPIKLDDNTSSKIQKSDEQNYTKFTDTSIKKFEENKTLDTQYKSVASQIEDFIKKQKAKHGSEKNLDEKTYVGKPDIVLYEENITKPKIEARKKTKQKKVKQISKNLPKLAIIMDDVGFFEEAKMIKKIPFAITPAIFPPNEHYTNTTKIAKLFKYHMVHLPMEAYQYKNIKEEAINVSDEIEIIEEKVRQLQENFPEAIAINNHTGSKYTCDFDAMEEFFTVLNRYDIDFIDSRTSSGSQCKEAGKLLNREVLERDIFLDNQADIDYIKNQLRKAVKIAKKNGQAIAICHPRKITFKALMSSSKILEDVELVYINEFL